LRVRFTAQARADLYAQLDWLAERTPQAARRAAGRIRMQLTLIGEFPHASPEVGDGLRDATVRFGRDGFVVRYRIDEEAVLIVRIFHGRQER
jgi:plasmid stabilization system protein ParE